MNTLEGEISKIGYNNKFGFIQSIIDENGIYFNFKNITENIQLYDKVNFEIIRNEQNKLEAVNIKLIEPFSLRIKNKYNLNNEIVPNQIINSISDNWKLEASLEKAKNYFYHNNEIDEIIKKDKCYIIGRKGSGKSSISEYLLNYKDSAFFSSKLSFKNFPFNELYNLDNKKFTPPNQYITIWKYLIYSYVAKLMVGNENIDANIRNSLAKIYSPEPINSLARTVEKWTSKKFGFQILGSGINIGITKDYQDIEFTWVERTNMLEDIIIKYCDNSNYYIIFDELDEDYREFKRDEYELYNYLITSLFKAVQDIKRTFISAELKIKPLIFLRDDIYSLIKDADKNKWRDFKVEIEWDIPKIKDMLSHRISIDADIKTKIEFKDIINLLFDSRYVNSMEPFDFITNSTHLRPRDYIRYFQVCAQETVSRNGVIIKSETIKFVDRAFSNYLRDEIKDEVFPLIPEIEEIFQIISNIGKSSFTYFDFIQEYNKYLKKGTIKEQNYDFVLDTLYKFSVIGNLRKKDKTNIFKYSHTNTNLSKEFPIIIHRGLFKSLQIF